MAPYIGPEVHKGGQPHGTARTADGPATADALQTLKAVQDLIGTYFAKSTPAGPAPSTLTPDATHVLSPDLTVKDDEACVPPTSPACSGVADAVPSIAAAQPSRSAANGGVPAGSPLPSDKAYNGGAIKDNDTAAVVETPIHTDKCAVSTKTSPNMASNGINGTTNGQGKPPGAGGTNGTTDSKPQTAGPGPGPKPGPPPLNKERLRSLAASISSNIDQLTTSEGPDAKAAHMKAAAAALELTASLRAPPEIIMNWFSTASVVSAVRLFLEWGVFDTIPAGPQGIPFSELAEKVQAEESLLIRVSWMLTSNSILKHIPSTPASLAHTPVSMLLRTGQPMSAMFKLMYTNIVEVSTILPPYFTTYGRHEPLGPAHIPTSFLAGQPHLEYFQHLNQDPARINNFMLAMGITHRNVPTTGMYPMDGVLAAASATPTRPIWIDIGGGDGHTVKIFLQTYPSLPATQCIVQDLPEVVSAAQEQITSSDDNPLSAVRFIPMDFHKDAPVPGARCYYLRHILRDYSDPTAINILKNLKRALTEEDSRILIAEQVIEDPPAAYAAFKDFAMLAIGGKERTLEGFRGIAEAAGLEVSGVFRDGVQAAHAVVEMKVRGEA